MTSLIRTQNVLHQAGPSFLPDPHQRMAKNLYLNSCAVLQSTYQSNPPFLCLCSGQLILSRREFGPSLLSLYVPMQHFLFQGGTSILCSLGRGFGDAQGCQQTCVAQCSWAVMNIQAVLRRAVAEGRLSSRQLRGKANLYSRSQKKAVATL